MATDQIHKPFDPLALENIGVTLALELLEKPKLTLPLAEKFGGSGVYMLYYHGDLPAYASLVDLNKGSERGWEVPVYVGRALRANAKQGFTTRLETGRTLYNRIMAHVKSIGEASNLAISDFSCRHLVLNDAYIPLAESVLITTFRPPWNGMGLGSNRTGKPRMEGKASLWDSLHPGREGRPKGNTEREQMAMARIAESTNALSTKHPDQATQAMIEKIHRRVGSAR